MNDAYSAAERRHLEEPEQDFCDVLGCTNEAEPESILCARHDDDLHDYRENHS